MAGWNTLAAGARWGSIAYSTAVRVLVRALTVGAGVGVVTMMLTICTDVVLRAFGSPLTGTVDIVRLAGAITIACALPYTSAVKGHVAIEYFFLKLSRRGRVVVDTFARLLSMALFACLSWESVQHGIALRRNGEVTATLQIPVFWIAHVIAFSCAVVILVTFHNMLHPGREMIKP